MPKRKILIQPPVRIVDPMTSEPIEGPEGALSFRDFFRKLFSNPLWNESFAAARAQDAIIRSIEEALTKKEDGFWVSEEDWKFLETCVNTPRFYANGQVLAGIGYHPAIARQILPFMTAVIDATTERG